MAEHISYTVNLSVTRNVKYTPDEIGKPAYANPTKVLPEPSSVEVTKIIQKAGSLAEVKRIATGLLALIPEDE